MSEQEGIYQTMMDRRVTEIAAREQVIETVRQIHATKSWQSKGYNSISEFCQRFGGYTNEEARQILISIGEIIPSEKLKSDDPVVQKRINMLRSWRTEKARSENLPAYIYLTNKTLMAIATNNPQSTDDLLLIDGIAKKKVESFGHEILNVLRLLEN